MKLKLDPKTALLTVVAVACIAAAVAKRTFFSTTTVDSAAFTTLSTNLLAQSTAADWRTLLSVPATTELISLSNNVVTISNTVNGHTTSIALGSNNLATVSNLVVALTAAQAALSNSLPAGTNIVTLNGTETITGPKTLTAALTATNPASVFAGNGAGLTNLALAPNRVFQRLLVYSNANLFISSVAVHAANLTNNGDFSLGTSMIQVTLPPLIGSNSMVDLYFTLVRTNSNSTIATADVYVGAGTNWTYEVAGNSQTLGVGLNQVKTFNQLFQNAGSMTQQYLNPATFVTGIPGPVSAIDTSANWDLKVCLSTVTSHTNVFLKSFWVVENVIP